LGQQLREHDSTTLVLELMQKEKKRKRVLGNSKAENKVFAALIQDLS